VNRARAAGAWLAVAVCAGAAGCRRPSAPPALPPSLVLVTVDTLRADHLGLYGYGRDTSPRLDAFAREARVFTRCYSQSATTGASHATIFTSLPPTRHGVFANRHRFPVQLPSLMSALRARGYDTAGFVSSVTLNRKTGLDRAFDHFDDAVTTREVTRRARGERPAADTLAAAADYLAGRSRARPSFVWIHLIDPHGPYQAPEDPDRYVADRGPAAPLLRIGGADWVFGEIPAYQALEGRRDPAFYVARYDAEIHYADAHLGAFFDRLRALGLLDRSVVALTADHGETLDDPGHKRYFAHGAITYEEVVRVPLVVREPGGGTRLRAVAADRPVALVDLAPTLLDLLGQPVPSAFEGRDLLHTPPVEDEPLFSLGAFGSDRLEKEIGTQFSVRRGPWRYVVNTRDGAEELFDHRTDPAEQRNVAAAFPAVRASRAAELGAFLSRRVSAMPMTQDPAQIEALRSLGYVQ